MVDIKCGCNETKKIGNTKMESVFVEIHECTSCHRIHLFKAKAQKFPTIEEMVEEHKKNDASFEKALKENEERNADLKRQPGIEWVYNKTCPECGKPLKLSKYREELLSDGEIEVFEPRFVCDCSSWMRDGVSIEYLERTKAYWEKMKSGGL